VTGPEPTPVWPARRKAILALTLSTAVLVALLALVFGLRSAPPPPPPPPANSPATEQDPTGYKPAWQTTKETLASRARLPAMLALVVSGWGLCLVFLLTVRTRRARVTMPLLFCVWWLALERLAAPHWIRLFGLWQLAIVRDVDHRPNEHGGQYNEDSLRWTRPRAEFHAEGTNLLFLGDSFAFGALVPANKAFPSVVQARLREHFRGADVKVANFAWVSSCPFLSLRRLKELGDAYAPDIVVECVDMTDFFDDIVTENMLHRRGLYALYDVLPLTLRIWHALAPDSYVHFLSWTVDGMPEQRFFHSLQPLEQSRHFLEPLLGHLRETEAWARERGAEFVVFVLPRSYQYSDHECPQSWEKDMYVPLGPHALEVFRWLDEIRPQLDFPLVSLLETFQQNQEFPTCMDDDPHWNATGHRVAAEAVLKTLLPLVERRLAR